MKMSNGVWFPDSETYLSETIGIGQKIDGKGTHQYHKLIAAMRYVRNFRCAVDAGMHVGLWAMHLVKIFKRVVGFEPAIDHIECLHKNLEGIKNYQVHNCALGSQKGSVGLKLLKGSSGSTHLDMDSSGIDMKRLDDFNLTDVDFLKIDVEGFEYFVVEGGKETILKYKPVIIVEQKGGKNEYYGKKKYDAKELLESWGAKTKFEIKGDFCLTWRN